MSLLSPFEVAALHVQKYYDVLFDAGAIALYAPSESVGTTLIDVAGGGNHGTITPDSEFSEHPPERKSLKGDGTRRVIVPIAVGLDSNLLTYIWIGILKTHTSNENIFSAFETSSKQLNLAHIGSNSLLLSHTRSGSTKTIPLTNIIPENELIMVQAVVDGADLTIICFHSGGVEINSGSAVGAMDATFTDIAIGAYYTGADPILAGTFIGLVSFYNKALVEDDGQRMYDQLMGRTLGADLVTNGDFVDWTGVAPNDQPDGWNTTEVGDATSKVTENPSGHLQMISDGTAVNIRQDAILEAGKIYDIKIVISAVGSGRLKVQFGSIEQAQKLDNVQTFTYTNILVDVAIFLIGRDGAGDVTIASVVAQEVTYTGVLASKVVYTEDISNDSVSAEAGYPDMDLYYRLTTLPSSGTYEFYARYVDANNNIRVSIAFDTGVATLYELDGGVETSLGTGGTFNDGDLLRLVLSDTQITVYENGGITNIITNTSSVGLTEETIVTDTGDGVVTVTAYDTFGV